MARKRDNAEETEVKVSEEISNEETRPARKRRVARVVDEPIEEAAPKAKTYTVKCDVLNVRLGPGYGFRVETQLLKGQTVNISKIDNEFGEILPGLWVAMKFLEQNEVRRSDLYGR